MDEFKRPNPIMDRKELELLEKITEDYKRYIEPSFLSLAAREAKEFIGGVIPTKVKQFTKLASNMASEAELIKQALNIAGQGFMELQKHSAKVTINKDAITNLIRKKNPSLQSYEQICTIRSYEIESILQNFKLLDLFSAFAEGAATGVFGLLGLPFNIVLSFFLHFRAAQSVALFYGYDVKDDPRELEFAAEVTMFCLSPNIEKGSTGVTGLIGRMMIASNFDAIKTALGKNLTYTEMAKRKGVELLFVQIRAMTNKAAQKALENAGQDNFEAGIFKKLLERISTNITKEAGKKAIPIIGAIIGGLNDTYYMNRILYGANLVYHKRFLFEKGKRIENLDI